MENKTAVVTGATSGIGAAYAKIFAEQGYDLIITGRRKEKIDSLAETIREKFQIRVEVVLAELSEEEGIQKVIEKTKGKQIEILVNNAGFGTKSLFYNCDINVAKQLANVNVIAPMELIRAILPDMVKRNSGTIINISSEGAYMIAPKNAVYSGAKAFLKTFTEGLHADLTGTSVKVLAVCPGLTHTDFHEKMGMEKARQSNKGIIRWMAPEEIVSCSLKDLQKGKVICFPGIHTRLMTCILSLIPRKMYYKVMYHMSRKLSSKQ